MSPRTAILVIAGVASVAMVGVFSTASHLRRTNAANHAGSSALLAELTARRDAALAKLNPPAAMSAVSSAASHQTSVAQRSATGSNTAESESRAIRRAVADDPTLQVLKQEADRALRHLKYATFVRSLSLTADQAKTLDRILQDHDARRLDLSRSISKQGLDVNDPAAVALRVEALQARAADLRALLGESGLEQFTAYERTVDLRQTVANYAVAATMMGEPLTASQTEAMVQILAESTQTYRTGGSATGGAIEWENAMPRLQAILSATQFAHISQVEPDALGGSTSRFTITFMSAARDAAHEADAAAATP